MCFTVMGRVQTRLYSLVWPLAVTIVFVLVGGSGDYWTLFALMALVGFALDAFVYPRFIGYQGRWLTIALGALEFVVIRLVAAIVPIFSVRLSGLEASLFYVCAWVGVWVTTQAVFPLLWPRWVEEGGEVG
jgi:hypothetical protein